MQAAAPDYLKKAFDWCLDHWSFVLFVIGMFVQFTPAIKLNPITALLSWIGKAINGEVLQQIAALQKRADEQRKSIDENEMDRIRWEVFAFANACRNHVRHTKDEFQHIIALNTKYHALLEAHGIENGVFDEEYAYILELYHRCQAENDFYKRSVTNDEKDDCAVFGCDAFACALHGGHQLRHGAAGCAGCDL